MGCFLETFRVTWQSLSPRDGFSANTERTRGKSHKEGEPFLPLQLKHASLVTLFLLAKRPPKEIPLLREIPKARLTKIPRVSFQDNL